MIEHPGVPVDKLATMDAQAIVGMLMRWYVREAQRQGFTLTAETARNAAISAVFGCMPDKPQPQGAKL
jgi:hypothetical protein